MKTIQLTLLIIFFASISFAQNLVINPSFEDTVSCPDDINQVDRAVGWYPVLYTPDYYNVCSSSFMIDVPINIYGYTVPADGNAYMGIGTYTSNFTNYREIIVGNLSQPLIPGIKYYISACIIRADTSIADCATRKFGFKFTTGVIGGPNIINNFSQFYSDSLYLDKINWSTISGSFIADSVYQYILIGNFFSDSFINVSQCSVTSSFHFGYNFIDQVCVSTDSLTCVLNCNSNVGIADNFESDAIKIFPNPTKESINIINSYNKPMIFSLFDMSNKIVLSHDFTFSTTINTVHLSKGIYFYKIRHENRIIKIGKIIIM